jgi:hypothetical protein
LEGNGFTSRSPNKLDKVKLHQRDNGSANDGSQTTFGNKIEIWSKDTGGEQNKRT